MATALQRFGDLVKVYRESRLVTQEQLAAQIRPPTNRSLIAHLEQGLRLPPARTLRLVCRYLEMPDALWRPFEIESFRSRVVLESEVGGTIARPPPRFIAVAGLMGSGKTTLARKIATVMGYTYLPASVTARGYLGDLNTDPSRWAFEAQLAFFCHKAIEVSDALRRNERIILDRTLAEDMHVFGKYFFDKGNIDKRSFDTYREVAGYFSKSLPSPDVVVYCHCKTDTAIERIRSRGRSDQFLHSSEFVGDISRYYKKWIVSHQDSLVMRADSDEMNWRDQVVAEMICRDIESVWLGTSSSSQQLALFDSLDVVEKPDSSPTQGLNLLETVFVPQRTTTATYGSSFSQLPPSSAVPIAYIAAPFTAQAQTRQPVSRNRTLFDEEPPHGTIAKGKYRSALVGIERALKGLGIDTLLPHRDVNRWGKLSLAPGEVMRLCTEHVSRSDLMVVVLGKSHGSHYEYGLARGLGKPCIVIAADDVESSFIGGGVGESEERILLLKCPTLASASLFLRASVTEQFLQRFMFI